MPLISQVKAFSGLDKQVGLTAAFITFSVLSVEMTNRVTLSQVQAFLATYVTMEVIHESVELPRSCECL